LFALFLESGLAAAHIRSQRTVWCIGKAIFRLIKKEAVFGEYYHRRKTEDKLSGKQLIAILQRKLPRVIYACARQRSAFCAERLSTCQSQYSMAA
jgi:hypothetical protein